MERQELLRQIQQRETDRFNRELKELQSNMNKVIFSKWVNCEVYTYKYMEGNVLVMILKKIYHTGAYEYYIIRHKINYDHKYISISSEKGYMYYDVEEKMPKKYKEKLSVFDNPNL